MKDATLRAMTIEEMISWLREDDERALEDLWRMADDTRRRFVGGEVHLRGLVEVSNHCARMCSYCGIRAPSRIQRYRMTREEVLECARLAHSLGYGTVVLQAGEDPGLTGPLISDIVRAIKAETPLAITLSLGERTPDELAGWRDAGADRYLLRFETSNEKLYQRIHPPSRQDSPSRLDLLAMLHDLGFEVGSGVMVGIPGQSYLDLARDLELFRELDLHMIGLGPFLPHPGTPIFEESEQAKDQAPASELMTYKMLALARLVCPRANIPSTTALSTLNLEKGRELGLARGANIVMPNLTPTRYRALYEIYPAKAAVRDTPEQCAANLEKRIIAMGRTIGEGRGDSPAKLHHEKREKNY